MNNQIFYFFYNLAHQSIFFDNLVIFFAVYFIYIVIASAFLFLLFYHKILFSQNPIKEFINKWEGFILVCMSGGFSWFFVKLIVKIFFHTPRPFVVFPQVQSLFAEIGYAFPSGHTAVASAIAFALFFTNKKTGYVFMFFALLVGIARIVAGVHFPIDILSGFVLGALVALLFKKFTLKFNTF